MQNKEPRDLIDRQAALNEIAEWMLEYGASNEKRERDALQHVARGIKKLPPVQPLIRTEMSSADDMISRQAAIDILDDFSNDVLQIWHGSYETARKKMCELQSAQPEIIRCKDCRHNGSFDTDCPIDWNGKEYCSFAER